MDVQKWREVRQAVKEELGATDTESTVAHPPECEHKFNAAWIPFCEKCGLALRDYRNDEESSDCLTCSTGIHSTLKQVVNAAIKWRYSTHAAIPESKRLARIVDDYIEKHGPDVERPKTPQMD